MKLKQKEFCHNCQQYVMYEFDDVTDRQIIICPNCGHQHYRELDDGTILNIRMEGRYQTELHVFEAPEMHPNFFDNDTISPIPLKTKIFKIKGQTEDGRPIIDKTEDTGDISHEQSKTISERRWGRDPRQ